MRWPWKRLKRSKADIDAHLARRKAEVILIEEQGRLVEARELAAALAGHQRRNNFAEAMRAAFGAQP